MGKICAQVKRYSFHFSYPLGSPWGLSFWELRSKAFAKGFSGPGGCDLKIFSTMEHSDLPTKGFSVHEGCDQKAVKGQGEERRHAECRSVALNFNDSVGNM